MDYDDYLGPEGLGPEGLARELKDKQMSAEELRRELAHFLDVHREHLQENTALHAELTRKKDQLATARKELRKSRQAQARLERAVEGYDEDEFDPAKQKGVGCIPIGGDFRQVEAVEKLFGMGPTLDDHFRQLGLGDGGQVAKILEAHVEVRNGDVRSLLAMLMSIALKCRLALSRDTEVAEPCARVPLEEARLVIAAIDKLPEQLLTDLVDIDGWDGRGLPPIKPAPTSEEDQRD